MHQAHMVLSPGWNGGKAAMIKSFAKSIVALTPYQIQHKNVYSHLNELYRKYKDATMIGSDRFIENLILADSVLKSPDLQHGAVVECGTWRGGMAAALIEI